MPHNPCPFPWWIESTQVQENWNRQNASQERYTSCTAGTGVTNCICPENDAVLRFSIDKRMLNTMTINDAFPVLEMDECLDWLGDPGILSTIDTNFWYWESAIDDRYKEKITFTTRHRLYQLLWMLLCLKNALDTFQCAVDIILPTIKWQFAQVYFDDIFTIFGSFEEHLDHILTVLGLLSRAGDSLKSKKLFFNEECIDYQGHVIQPGRLVYRQKHQCDSQITTPY